MRLFNEKIADNLKSKVMNLVEEFEDKIAISGDIYRDYADKMGMIGNVALIAGTAGIAAAMSSKYMVDGGMISYMGGEAIRALGAGIGGMALAGGAFGKLHEAYYNFKGKQSDNAEEKFETKLRNKLDDMGLSYNDDDISNLTNIVKETNDRKNNSMSNIQQISKSEPEKQVDRMFNRYKLT